VTRPRLLDLFCGAGGAAVGYHRAGFDIVGIDIVDQPRYPFEFIQEDALKFVDSFSHPYPAYKASEFDAIHASPPCQAFTAYKRRPGHVAKQVSVIPQIRRLLKESGSSYVIENVFGSELQNFVQLCGTSFGLDVRRHRWFESNVAMLAPPCNHDLPRRFPPATNRINLRRTIEIGVWRIPLSIQQQAMGIDWMTLEELSEAIPPAYTQWIGAQLIAHLEAAA
jgi:DNA (cytosine-5)-methyltransferase 1